MVRNFDLLVLQKLKPEEDDHFFDDGVKSMLRRAANGHSTLVYILFEYVGRHQFAEHFLIKEFEIPESLFAQIGSDYGLGTWVAKVELCGKGLRLGGRAVVEYDRRRNEMDLCNTLKRYIAGGMMYFSSQALTAAALAVICGKFDIFPHKTAYKKFADFVLLVFVLFMLGIPENNELALV